MLRRNVWIGVALIFLVGSIANQSMGPSSASGEQPAGGRTDAGKVFRAGAESIDISPKHFPAIVSGGFLQKQASGANDPLHARCFVLDDGTTTVAIAVIDTLLMPRDLLDGAKEEIERTTGIPADRILISATHTHSAPSVVGALGTGVDEDYVRRLPGWIVEGVQRAAKKLAPAKVGWAVVKDAEHTNCRRWIRRPDKIGEDPFGGRTVRAMMHPGYQNPDYVGPAGPEDPYLSVLAVQSPDGRPIALVANYSMHYYGAKPVSADYYGRFVQRVTQLITPQPVDPPPVAAMSQGTSGDLHWMDYSQPAKPRDIDAYAEAVAKVAYEAYKTVRYHDWAPLAMAERKLTLRRRVPDEKRLAWAREKVKAMGGRKPKDRPEVYALEQIYLHQEPVRQLKLQALRVGELGITAIPCEVFGITGLKIKAQSPLQPTFNLELANGAEGYIPPPEQHRLGGYTTWPARSAGLEEEAEPKIVEAVLGLLEEVSGRPRRNVIEPQGPYPQAVLASRPAAYWRMGELNGPRAADATGHGHHGVYEDGVAFYLEGPVSEGFCGERGTKRAAHFAGGRMRCVLDGLGSTYSVQMWFWNGMPNDARPVTGYLVSRGVDDAADAAGDHLGIGGAGPPSDSPTTGRLFFSGGDASKEVLCGTTEITPKTWNYVVLVRDGEEVAVYLNGNTTAEISGRAAVGFPPGVGQLFIGGRNDNFSNFEGKIAEVAVYDRALTAEEIARHYAAATAKKQQAAKGLTREDEGDFIRSSCSPHPASDILSAEVFGCAFWW